MAEILDCTNLLGDSLYLLRPVSEYLKRNEVVSIVADKGLSFELFRDTFRYQYGYHFVQSSTDDAKTVHGNYPVKRISAGEAGAICMNGGNQLHISEGYAKMLGVNLGHDISPLLNWQRVMGAEPRTHIAISPFSKSCSRHSGETPNKTLDDYKWEYIIRYLRRQGLPVKVIAGPNDRLKSNSIPLNDYFTARSLYELEYFLKSCALLVTLDNGLGHIASAIHTPMISLWPKVSSVPFIYPRFSSKTACVLMEPNTATPAQLLAGIRQFAIPMLEDLLPNGFSRKEVFGERKHSAGEESASA